MLIGHNFTVSVEVTVSKDVPGFVSNALLMPFINEVGQNQFMKFNVTEAFFRQLCVWKRGPRLGTILIPLLNSE